MYSGISDYIRAPAAPEQLPSGSKNDTGNHGRKITVKRKYDFELYPKLKYRGTCYELQNINSKYALAFRIAKGEFIYAEYRLLREGEICEEPYYKIITQQDVVSKRLRDEKNIIACEYLMSDEKRSPNFVTCNDAYYGLVEEDFFNGIIDEMMADVDAFIGCLKPEYKITRK